MASTHLSRECRCLLNVIVLKLESARISADGCVAQVNVKVRHDITSYKRSGTRPTALSTITQIFLPSTYSSANNNKITVCLSSHRDVVLLVRGIRVFQFSLCTAVAKCSE